MNETGIKAVAGADRIHGRHAQASAAPFCGAFSRDSSVQAKFYDDELAKLREFIDRLLQIIGARDFFCFALVREEYVNERQDLQQIPSPLSFRVIVGVQRSGKALGLSCAKQISDARAQGPVQEVGREVQVSCGKNIIQIQIGVAEFKHGAGIREDEAMRGLRENHRQTGRGTGGRAARSHAHTRQIHAGIREPVECHFAQRIRADF